ncbi:hypothetical protein [Streptomyces sp. PR69]|uniref:hypothetical protein n=1 Tax=Streptomyces sp. PR69 TaxID=2984950 RepID=UPI0022649DFC|nr:hypothetical protein [Streptomyces sp. PR69]
MPLIRPIRCPAAPLIARAPQTPRPAGLACSITVPGEPHSAAIVRHPRHRDPDAVSVCEERRRRSLWLLDAMAEEHGGDWGMEEAHPPHRGTKSWALLPCEGFAVRRTRSGPAR